MAWLPNPKLSVPERVTTPVIAARSKPFKELPEIQPHEKKKPGKVSEKDLFKGNFYFFKKKRCIGATVSVICLSSSVVLQFVYINRFPLIREMFFHVKVHFQHLTLGEKPKYLLSRQQIILGIK